MEQPVFGGEHHSGRPTRPLWSAMWKGFRGKCPHCGEGRLFSSFIQTVAVCDHCSEQIDHHRADDLPAYLVVVIVGHIVLGAFMGVEATTTLSTRQHLAIWVQLTIVLAVALLRPVKGAIVGLQWALYMHGFGARGRSDRDASRGLKRFTAFQRSRKQFHPRTSYPKVTSWME